MLKWKTFKIKNMVEVISDTWQKAKKEHVCNLCGNKIQIGEIYHDKYCRYDNAYHWKSHERCLKLTYKLDMWSEAYDGLNSESFWEFIHNEYCNIQESINPKQFEYKNYIKPKPNEKLEFVCNYYLWGSFYKWL